MKVRLLSNSYRLELSSQKFYLKLNPFNDHENGGKRSEVASVCQNLFRETRKHQPEDSRGKRIKRESGLETGIRQTRFLSR